MLGKTKVEQLCKNPVVPALENPAAEEQTLLNTLALQHVTTLIAHHYGTDYEWAQDSRTGEGYCWIASEDYSATIHSVGSERIVVKQLSPVTEVSCYDNIWDLQEDLLSAGNIK